MHDFTDNVCLKPVHSKKSGPVCIFIHNQTFLLGLGLIAPGVKSCDCCIFGGNLHLGEMQRAVKNALLNSCGLKRDFGASHKVGHRLLPAFNEYACFPGMKWSLSVRRLPSSKPS